MATYFTFAEMTFSEEGFKRGIDNTPPPLASYNLGYLVARILDPLRKHFNVPILVNSGFRSREVNDLVGGSERSFHLVGRAADIRPKDPALLDEMYDYIMRYLPYVELKKYKTFIHVAV